MGEVIRMPRPESARARVKTPRRDASRGERDFAKTKRFSGEEALPPSLGPKVSGRKEASASAAKKGQTPSSPASEAPKPSSPTKARLGGKKLRLSIGKESGVTSGTLRKAVLGETGLPAEALGNVVIQAKHATIEISPDQAKAVVANMKRANIGGKRVKASLV